MVEIRVGVADVAVAHGLMRRLASLFDLASVSFDGVRNEVRVRSEWESRAVVEVIEAVEWWLTADAVSSAELSIGDRSYTMVGPARVDVPEREGMTAPDPLRSADELDPARRGQRTIFPSAPPEHTSEKPNRDIFREVFHESAAAW
jgi:hypothetical protein